MRHIYILGATGSGKTKLIEWLIRQDILTGRGFGVLDLHGDLTRNMLYHLSSLIKEPDALPYLEYLSDKLVLIEPFDPKGAIGFNPLETGSIPSFSLVAELMGVFRKIWQDAHFGARTEELLRNTLLTLSEHGLTLLEVAPLLTPVQLPGAAGSGSG